MKTNIEDKGKCGIYCITNANNGKMYIGKAKCVHSRMISHISDLNRKDPDENIHLIHSWHKYGSASFSYRVLEYLPLDDILVSNREIYWQLYYKVTDRTKGYNLRLDSSTKMIVHEETRVRLSEAQKRRFSNPEEVEKVRKTEVY